MPTHFSKLSTLMYTKRGYHTMAGRLAAAIVDSFPGEYTVLEQRLQEVQDNTPIDNTDHSRALIVDPHGKNCMFVHERKTKFYIIFNRDCPLHMDNGRVPLSIQAHRKRAMDELNLHMSNPLNLFPLFPRDLIENPNNFPLFHSTVRAYNLVNEVFLNALTFYNKEIMQAMILNAIQFRTQSYKNFIRETMRLPIKLDAYFKVLCESNIDLYLNMNENIHLLTACGPGYLEHLTTTSYEAFQSLESQLIDTSNTLWSNAKIITQNPGFIRLLPKEDHKIGLLHVLTKKTLLTLNPQMIDPILSPWMAQITGERFLHITARNKFYRELSLNEQLNVSLTYMNKIEPDLDEILI